MIIFFLFFLSFFSFHASFLQRHRSAERRTRREIIRISTVCSLSTFLNSILIEFVVSLASTVMFPRTRNSVLPISTNEKLFKQQFSCSHNYHSNEYVIFVLEKKREKKKKERECKIISTSQLTVDREDKKIKKTYRNNRTFVCALLLHVSRVVKDQSSVFARAIKCDSFSYVY